MTKKYIQFGMDNGNLYYRNTGQYYTKSYTIKNKTVYGANGRKIGTIGKATKTQEKKLESAKKSRAKKVRKTIKEYGGKPTGFDVGDLAELHDTAPWVDVPIDRYQRELMNLGKILNDCVDAGKMSKETATAYLNRWMDCKNDSERNELWGELKKYFKDKGYRY